MKEKDLRELRVSNRYLISRVRSYFECLSDGALPSFDPDILYFEITMACFPGTALEALCNHEIKHRLGVCGPIPTSAFEHFDIEESVDDDISALRKQIEDVEEEIEDLESEKWQLERRLYALEQECRPVKPHPIEKELIAV